MPAQIPLKVDGLLNQLKRDLKAVDKLTAFLNAVQEYERTLQAEDDAMAEGNAQEAMLRTFDEFKERLK
jgi:hypothetical protein